MYKYNLIYYPFILNGKKYYGFLDTGGGQTFFFKNKELMKYTDEVTKYIEIKDFCRYSPNKVVIFIGQNFFKDKVFRFDYKDKIVEEVKRGHMEIIYNDRKQYEMVKSKKADFIHIDITFEGKKQRFLFDTGATLERNNKEYGISFLDGEIFDKLPKSYKVIENYDEDGSSVVIIPEITIFDKKIKNVKFLRRNNNNFLVMMSGWTRIKHIGAIGGNILKNFNIICDYKNKKYYVE
jgi:hypothetical protein